MLYKCCMLCFLCTEKCGRFSRESIRHKHAVIYIYSHYWMLTDYVSVATLHLSIKWLARSPLSGNALWDRNSSRLPEIRSQLYELYEAGFGERVLTFSAPSPSVGTIKNTDFINFLCFQKYGDTWWGRWNSVGGNRWSFPKRQQYLAIFSSAVRSFKLVSAWDRSHDGVKIFRSYSMQ